MSTIGNPGGLGSIITEAGILRESFVKSAIPAVKEIQKVPDKKSAGDNKTSTEFKKGNSHSKTDEPARAASVNSANVRINNIGLGFVYDNEIKKAIMRIVDEETREVVLQVPPEEVIEKIKADLVKNPGSMSAGVIVDKKV